jgi:hypothetical protein
MSLNSEMSPSGRAIPSQAESPMTSLLTLMSQSGWVDWGDWLGTGRIADRDREYRPFDKARDDARSRRLKTGADWIAFTKSGNLPPDIPAAPWQTYRDKGWTSMGDWLGSGMVAKGKEIFLPFSEARDHARSLPLKSQAAWKAYCSSGDKPKNIPAHPEHVYRKMGWLGWGDWLGSGVTATRTREYRSFVKARAFAHTLELETRSGWRAYCKSGRKPEDIPARPDNTYAEQGWAGWIDWLGCGDTRKDLLNAKDLRVERW